MKRKSLTIRASNSWFNSFEHLLLERLGRNPQRDRADLIRELVSEEAQLYEFSPYYAKNTRYFVFVRADGVMFHWMAQHLYLLERRVRLPSEIRVKPEKRHQYLHRADARDSTDPHRKWLLNYFAVWKGMQLGPDRTELIVQDTDRFGAMSKYADLPIEEDKDTSVCREILVANRDYVRHRDEGGIGADDRADIFIDVPTMRMDVKIIVDLELYKDLGAREDARLGYEFRNRELARFSERRLSPKEGSIRWDDGRFPPASFRTTTYDSLLESIQRTAGRFRRRLGYVCSEDRLANSDHLPITEEQDRDYLQSVRLPDSYLFGQLKWDRPYRGLVVSLTWNRPE